MGMNGIDWQS